METKKLNLVVFMREYPIGMAGTKRIQHLLEYLTTNNLAINVIAFRSNIPQPAGKGVHNSIPYVCVGQGTEMKLSHIFKILLFYLRGLKIILKLKDNSCTNIVYNSGGISIENFLFILWARILGFRLILAIEEDYSFFRDDIKRISKFKFRTVKRFDFLNCHWAHSIVVVSTYLRDKYLKMGARNVRLIPVTAKLNFNENKSSFNSPLTVIYAGTFADKDGVKDILEGFLDFNRDYKDAILILTGMSSQQLIYHDLYKNEKSLIFKGFVEDRDFYPLLRDADVLCMCRTESGFANAGFPFKLGEYLATGNPVICTRVSDVEIYLDEGDAFLIDPGSPAQICQALKKIIADPVLARKTGLKGFEKCRQHFSPESNGRLLYELIELISNN